MSIKLINYINVIARRANQYNEIPMSSILTKKNIVITQHYNIKRQRKNILHSEMLCINDAIIYLSENDLRVANIYSLAQPCNMCVQAIAISKVSKMYFSVYNKKFGATRSIDKKKTKISNKINKSIKILQYFFKKNRRVYVTRSMY